MCGICDAHASDRTCRSTDLITYIHTTQHPTEDAGPVCPGTVARAALGKGKESPTLVLEIPTSGGECELVLLREELLLLLWGRVRNCVRMYIWRRPPGVSRRGAVELNRSNL